MEEGLEREGSSRHTGDGSREGDKAIGIGMMIRFFTVNIKMQ